MIASPSWLSVMLFSSCYENLKRQRIRISSGFTIAPCD
jgi:hypothetical protein